MFSSLAVTRALCGSESSILSSFLARESSEVNNTSPRSCDSNLSTDCSDFSGFILSDLSFSVSGRSYFFSFGSFDSISVPFSLSTLNSSLPSFPPSIFLLSESEFFSDSKSFFSFAPRDSNLSNFRFEVSATNFLSGSNLPFPFGSSDSDLFPSSASCHLSSFSRELSTSNFVSFVSDASSCFFLLFSSDSSLPITLSTLIFSSASVSNFFFKSSLSVIFEFSTFTSNSKFFLLKPFPFSTFSNLIFPSVAPFTSFSVSESPSSSKYLFFSALDSVFFKFSSSYLLLFNLSNSNSLILRSFAPCPSPKDARSSLTFSSSECTP